MAHLLLELNPSRTTWHTSLEIFNPSGMTESSRGDRTETASLILGYSLISFNNLVSQFFHMNCPSPSLRASIAISTLFSPAAFEILVKNEWGSIPGANCSTN